MSADYRLYAKSSGQHYNKNIKSEYIEEYTRKNASSYNHKVQKSIPNAIHSDATPLAFTTKNMIDYAPKQFSKNSPMRAPNNLGNYNNNSNNKVSSPFKATGIDAYAHTSYKDQCDPMKNGPTFSPVKNHPNRTEYVKAKLDSDTCYRVLINIF